MRTSLPVKKDNKEEFATFYLVFCERVGKNISESSHFGVDCEQNQRNHTHQSEQKKKLDGLW